MAMAHVSFMTVDTCQSAASASIMTNYTCHTAMAHVGIMTVDICCCSSHSSAELLSCYAVHGWVPDNLPICTEYN